jgi:outer membrane protein OmpA-like peptidoglycan-associated protein
MIQRLRIILLLLLSSNVLLAQELVVNGNFEHENICIEYNQTCSPDAWRNTAYLPFGYQKQPIAGHEGVHYLPMVVEDVGVSNFRTYWQTVLKCPLQKGANYKISFYASSLGAQFIPSNLGLHFSQAEIMQRKVWPIMIKPAVQVRERDVTYIKKSDWVKVEIDYTATGNEQFLVLGNFLPDHEMTRHRKPKSQKVTYCVDELSVKKIGDSTVCEPSTAAQQWLAGRLRHTPNPYEQPIVKKQPPVTPAPVAAPRIDTLVLQDVLFKFDSGSLTPAASLVLDTIVARLQQRPFKKIRVEGHTDSLGTESYNLDLSGRRANSVMQYFVGKGMDTKLIQAEGKGELRPVATNKSDEGRRRNRRVEILVEY